MVLVNIIVWGFIFVWGSILNRKDLGLEYAWVWFKGRVKTACDSSERCKDIRAYIRKNPAISFSYFLFVIFSIVFGISFPWFFYSFITSLYTAVDQKLKDGIDVNSYGFRSISLSIAGSITLLITILGVLLTLIRNLLTRQQNRTDEERLVTEQISRAVEQMGAYQTANGEIRGPNIEVRLGGLYSLQRIMKDSARDMLPIAKILYAYVRENVKRVRIKKETGEPPLPEDIDSALNIIIQFKKEWKKQFGVFPTDSQLNFSHTDFTEYSLNGMDFSYAILEYADLSDADLSDADLSGANLSGAKLLKTKLYGANLVGANLSSAVLFDGLLSRADLSGANLSFTKLSGANLSSAKLSSADLSFINLSGANLYGANLSNVDLSFTNLSDVNLSNTNLFNTNLSSLNLSGANLSGVNLQDKDLTNTNLSGADLSNARNLTQDQINQARGDENTKLPEGLTHPEFWEDDDIDDIDDIDDETWDAFE